MNRRWFFPIAIALSTGLSADVVNVTKENYSSVVEQSNKPVIADVYASWCPPCRNMAPLFDAASERYSDILFVKIDCDAEPELVNRFEVNRLPTLLFILPGQDKPSMRSTGSLTEKTLNEKISQFQKMATFS